MIICLWDRAGESVFLMMQQSRVVTPWLRPLCQKGHSTFFLLLFTAFPLHQDPLPLSTSTSGSLRSSISCKRTSSFLWHWLFFVLFFFKHSFQFSTNWWSVFTTEESWCTAQWFTIPKDAGSPPSITSAAALRTVQPACRVSTSPLLISSSMSASAILPAGSWATWREVCWCGPIRKASSSNGCARAESSGWGWRTWDRTAAPCPANWRGTLLWRSLTQKGFSKVRLCV